MKWHPYRIECPTCRKAATTIDVSLRRDYKIMIEAHCYQCDKDFESEVYLYKIVENLKDMENNPYSPDFQLDWFEVKGRPN